MPPMVPRLHGHRRFHAAVSKRYKPEGLNHKDHRTASTPATAPAAAKNIAKRSASYAHANPRLNKETSAITVSSRTLRSNPSPPLWREHTLALSRTNPVSEEQNACLPTAARHGDRRSR